MSNNIENEKKRDYLFSSTGLRFAVFERDNFTCQYCGRSTPEVKIVIDHVIPISLGGSNETDNLVACCTDCNSAKGAKLVKPFKTPEKIIFRPGYFTPNKTRAVRMSDEAWDDFKDKRWKSKMGYDKFIRTLLSLYEKHHR